MTKLDDARTRLHKVRVGIAASIAHPAMTRAIVKLLVAIDQQLQMLEVELEHAAAEVADSDEVPD